MSSGNDFLDFYGENGIDTSKQNIDDINLHFKRRRKLYIQLGMPPHLFNGARIIDLGCGSGTNALAFIKWGSRVDLVDANHTSIENLINMYELMRIPKTSYRVFEKKIEDIDLIEDYDIVLAEGFLHSLDRNNQEIIVDAMKRLVNAGGVCVVTCEDFVCLYVEAIKRLIGYELSKGISSFDEKVKYLVSVFEPQLRQLKGMSRSADEWVEDMILNPSMLNGNEFTIEDAIDLFGEGFDILGGSPSFITDYSWYKDIWYDKKTDSKKQFRQKRLSFLLAGMPEIIVKNQNTVSKAVDAFENIKKSCVSYELSGDKKHIEKARDYAKIIREYEELFPDEFMKVFIDTESVLSDIVSGDMRVEKYENLYAAFGRTLQYISFVRMG